jgi:hypothetical protein
MGDFPRAASIVRSLARSWRAMMRGPRRDGFRRRFSPKRGWILELALMRHLIAFDLFNVA